LTEVSLAAVRARSIALYLLWGACALALMSVAGQVWRYYSGSSRFRNIIGRFFVDSEQSVPTWYQIAMLLGCVFITAFIVFLEKEEGGVLTRSWTALACIFALLSIDEAASFHEFAGKTMTRYVGSLGFVQFTWVLLGAIVVVAFVIHFRGFFARLDRRDRRLIAAALALYVAGAFGMEVFAGVYVAGRDLVQSTTTGIEDPLYAIVLTTIEESLEMGGIILLVYALLVYLARHYPHIAIRSSSKAGISEGADSSGRSRRVSSPENR
jgi:hypothetical protein